MAMDLVMAAIDVLDQAVNQHMFLSITSPFPFFTFTQECSVTGVMLLSSAD